MKSRLLTIQNIYLCLVLGNTLAASFIWGINTIFLLDAGLSNFEAFLANSFFTLGQVLFEVPTGVVADTYGRRTSYLLGCITLAASTFLYLLMWQIHGSFWGWAVSSMLLGLGYTFFSGALEAWLVDALKATDFTGNLDTVFAQGQMFSGIAMLIGSISGGVIAQITNLGVPYIIRCLVLGLNFATAFFLMKDLGFTSRKAQHPIAEMKNIVKSSVEYGWRNPAMKWLMIAGPFAMGVSLYVFYALQPFLLELYGDTKAYGIAGLVAAISALAQILGGIAVPYIRKLFTRRTHALISGTFITGIILLLVGFVTNFWLALVLIFIWGLLFAALTPIRQSYLNGMIPSEQRATILSFDSVFASTGGVVIQPALGKAADVWSYPTSYMIAALVQSLAIPFLFFSRKQQVESDVISSSN